MIKKKILIFTGAGIDAESGVQTFRDSGGLWDNYSPDDVATISGWRRNGGLVLDFYNKRRAELKDVYPNRAHEIIADLENYFDVTVVTQNVTDLHQRAGSSNVIHLHGELKKVRSTVDPQLIYDWEGDCNLGDRCREGSQLRPHIVWFGETLDSDIIESVANIASECDFCIVVGTSMKVSPANTIPFLTGDNCSIYYVDPSDVDFFIPPSRMQHFKHINDIASVGLEGVKLELIENK